MVKSVDPVVLQVSLDTWGKLKEIDDYEHVAGQKIMKFLFAKCPKAKPMFGYDLYAEVDDLLTDPKFIAHSKQLISMFDMAFVMLGLDAILLAEKMKELGEKHVNYGVQAEMFPIMGKALVNMFEELMGDDFTDAICKSWKVVFNALSQNLMITVLKAKNKRSDLSSEQISNNPVAA